MALTVTPAELTATALTLTTAAQPNITSVGTLTGLTVSGNIAGTLTTAAQTNITSLGTLSDLTVSGNVGIGNARTDGTLHVLTASAGTVAASTQADDLVIENSAEGGMTIITPDDQSARIRFTSPSTNNDVGGAHIFYRQNINKMNIGTNVSGGTMSLLSGAGNETLILGGSGLVGIGAAANFSTLEVTGDKTTANNLQLTLRGATNTNKQLIIGFDTTADKSYITSQIAGSAQKPLIINAANVGIGGDPQSWSKLQVTGTAGAQTGATQALYVNAPTATNGHGVGIRLSAASGSREAVGIIGMVNNASGNAGSMTFHTYNGGATIPEVMRIDNVGRVTKPFTPAFSCNSSGTYTTTTGDQNLKTFACSNATSLNTGSHLSGGKFTAPVAGVYQFHLKARTDYSSGYLFVYVFKEGTGMSNAYLYPPQGIHTATLSFVVAAAAGDEFEPYCNTNYAGGSITAILFSGYLIG